MCSYSVSASYDATYGFSDKKILESDNTDAMSPLEIHFRCRNTLAERSRLQLVHDRICNNEEISRARAIA